MKPSRRNCFVLLAAVGALVATVAAWDAPASAQTSPPVATVTIGVPSDGVFRKGAKEFFGLERPEEISLGWQRTPQFLYPKPWPDKAAIRTEIKRLERTRELGILPANATADIFWE